MKLIFKTMNLKIDYREAGIIDKLKASNSSMKYEVVPLEVGDFHFEKDGKLYAAIERKTEADLNASLKDGRWREQKERLEVLRASGVKVIFLIEKIDANKRAFIEYNLLYGAILNTLFRDQYPVLYTENMTNTIEYIDLLYKKIERGDFEKTMGSSLETNASSLKKKLTNTSFFLSCLLAIPRVSLDIAKRINEEYKNLDELIGAYKIKGKELLASIEVGKDDKKRKLGKKLSSDIYNYLFNLQE